MKTQYILGVALALLTLNATAQYGYGHEPDAERQQVINQYVLDLQKADAVDISQLFVDGGYVVSTSRGKVNANNFFNAFLPNLIASKTQLNGIYKSTTDPRLYTARFHFTFTLKDGEQGDGEYVDEFAFAGHSIKLTSVSMFENLKFPAE